MLAFLPAVVTASFSFVFYIVNTLFWLVPVLVFSLCKAALPLKKWRQLMSYLLDQMASNWVLLNTVNQQLFTPVKFNTSGLEQLQKNEWYLVISNHQSWVDVLVLQRLLHARVPFLKFFLKKELIYVPFLGLAWWALDFPFMKRYNRAFLQKYPHLKGQDIETTRKACARFKYKPVSIMNFIEGTRFTPEKLRSKPSGFQHLLTPKAGGIALVLDAMGEQLSKIIDVTIHYPQGIPSFIDFLLGRVKSINVAIRTLPIEETPKGDYFNDAAFKERFQQWVNQLWVDKNAQLAGLVRQHNKH